MKKTLLAVTLSLSVVASANFNQHVSSRSGQEAVIQDSNAQQMVRVKNRGGALFFEDFQTQADPLNPVLPAGWVVVDVDGQTPASTVAQFTAAWIAGEDFDNAGDFNMQSTSWYSPPGQSDDWVITPAVMIGSNTELSWRAEAQDPGFPDGYEVYISTTTQDVAGCSANPPVFAIGAESGGVFTERSVDLATAGFSNENVMVCFRNNSNDQFVLMVDDVMLAEGLSNNISIAAIAAPPEYTQYPVLLGGYDIPLSVEVSNIGINDQVNVLVEAEIFVDAMSVDTVSGSVATLDSGTSEVVDLGAYSTTVEGTYDIVYTVSIDGVTDDDPSDNQAESLANLIITAQSMARDDGLVAGVLGIGGENGGYLGNQFDFDVPAAVSGVLFAYSNENCNTNPPNECSLDGESIQVDVFAIDEVTGLPDVMVGSTEAHVVPVGVATGTEVTVDFATPLELLPGQYVFAVTEPTRTVSTWDTITLQLNYTNSRFTPTTTWIDWPTNPVGDWANSEDFGFQVAYVVRPQFTESDVIFYNGFD